MSKSNNTTKSYCSESLDCSIYSAIRDTLKTEVKCGSFNKNRVLSLLNANKGKLNTCEVEQLEYEIESTFNRAKELGFNC